jgi:hypothetical protein
VLLVHGDDDHNAPFQQTTDLIEKSTLKTSRSKLIIADVDLLAVHLRNESRF